MFVFATTRMKSEWRMNDVNSTNQSETKKSVFSFDALGFQLFLVLREILVCGQIYVNTTSESFFVAIFVNRNSVKIPGSTKISDFSFGHAD